MQSKKGKIKLFLFSVIIIVLSINFYYCTNKTTDPLNDNSLANSNSDDAEKSIDSTVISEIPDFEIKLEGALAADENKSLTRGALSFTNRKPFKSDEYDDFLNIVKKNETRIIDNFLRIIRRKALSNSAIPLEVNIGNTNDGVDLIGYDRDGWLEFYWTIRPQDKVNITNFLYVKLNKTNKDIEFGLNNTDETNNFYLYAERNLSTGEIINALWFQKPADNVDFEIIRRIYSYTNSPVLKYYFQEFDKVNNSLRKIVSYSDLDMGGIEYIRHQNGTNYSKREFYDEKGGLMRHVYMVTRDGESDPDHIMFDYPINVLRLKRSVTNQNITFCMTNNPSYPTTEPPRFFWIDMNTNQNRDIPAPDIDMPNKILFLSNHLEWKDIDELGGETYHTNSATGIYITATNNNWNIFPASEFEIRPDIEDAYTNKINTANTKLNETMQNSEINITNYIEYREKIKNLGTNSSFLRL